MIEIQEARAHGARFSAAGFPYDEDWTSKSARLCEELLALTAWHESRCAEYARILRTLYPHSGSCGRLEDLPYLPVRLFKMLRLASVPELEIMKTLTSSGTTSQIPSQVFLDKATASAQSRVLTAIVKSFLGPSRLPMAIIDSPGVLADRSAFSARGAGILGFSQFGAEPVYLLDNNLELDWAALYSFLERTQGRRRFLFGFTSIVWRHFYEPCLKGQRRFDFGDSILIHGGGWKKLAELSISNQQFKEALYRQLGIRRVHNYYGMVEQAGSIFMECDAGFFHASAYSDVLARDPDSLQPLSFGATGLLQVLSTIPRSYPGHVLLTEDMGAIAGEDDCCCGRRGKYFTVQGRLAQAELRGCSDTRGGG